MVAFRDEGKIGGIGISNVTLDQLRQALPAGLVCVQNAYSLLDRSGEPLLHLCREHGMAWVPYFPLGSAFPGMPKVTEDPAVVAAAGSLGVTPAQIGLAWLLAHAAHLLLIPGTSSPEHLADNVAAGRRRPRRRNHGRPRRPGGSTGLNSRTEPSGDGGGEVELVAAGGRR